MSELDAARVASDVFSADDRLDPYPIYERLRELDPVHFNPVMRMWFLTRHADCVAVLRDRSFSAELGQRLRRRDEELPASMLTTDPPGHTRLRKPVNDAFATRNLDGLRSRLPGLVDDSLERLPGNGAVDLVSGFARTFAARVLADLFDVPDGDLDHFRETTFETAANLDPLAEPEDQRRASTAARTLGAYFHQRLERPDAASANDVLRVLVGARDSGHLTPAELVSTCVLCVVGGHEPLAGLIANGVLRLLRHPDQLARARERGARGSEILDEVLRLDSPIPFVARVARADVDLGGKTIGKGEPVLALLAAANRDPELFTDGLRFDVGRRPNPHLSFGAGVHRCPGATLTELAGLAAVAGLLRRFPELELLAEEVEWRSSVVPRGPATLPVVL
jgi:cytochrome P450